MKKIITITESDLVKIIKRVISEETGSEIKKLPQAIQNAIKKLKTNYGITITDDHIKKELEQEGNWRSDNGSVNTNAKTSIDNLIIAAKKEFPELASYGLISGYRSYDKQVINFGNKVKSGRSIDNVQRANTIPGFSQHHTGRAFDIFSVNPGWWNSRPKIKQWVADNAEKYGFIVTYKTPGILRIAEPWHLYYTK